MKRCRNSGQSVILALLVIPLFILVGSIIFRSGNTALSHTAVQHHCDQKVLDSLTKVAWGLENLGKLNPKAQAIIDARRVIDIMLLASVVNPTMIPALIKARNVLKASQKVVNAAQKTVMSSAELMAVKEFAKSPPSRLEGKIARPVNVENLLSFTDLKIHVQKKWGYGNETGAPLELETRLFQTVKHSLKLELKMKTEEFLKKWQVKKDLPDMKIQCQAEIKIEDLEAPWEVVLTSAAKL